MAPPFFFEVTEIQKHPLAQPRFHSPGTWLPPKVLGYNVQKPGSQRRILCFNQVNAVVTQSVPPDAELFKTVSTYYDNENFWVVPYDILQNSVYDGVEHSDSSSEDSSSGDESYLSDWKQITFDQAPGDHTFTSYVTAAGYSRRLLLQRTDQTWVQKLFPERYHSSNVYPPTHHQYGGLTGDLPLVIALIAFSASPNDLIAALQQCLTGQNWGVHSFTRGRGWIDRRGIMIRIWTWPRPPPHLQALASTRDDLRRLENGELGKIYT